MFARSETFQGLLHEAIALGKSPILAAFVADCVEEGGLLDETDYVLESVANVKALKRGRQNAFSIKVETSETFPQLTKTVKPKPSPVIGKGKEVRETPLADKKLKKIPKSAVSKYAVEAREDPSRSRSPTPPAATTRQMMRNGKYLFTEVEDEYFLNLAKHHLTCDPTISNTALINKLHKKVSAGCDPSVLNLPFRLDAPSQFRIMDSPRRQETKRCARRYQEAGEYCEAETCQ